MLWLQFYFGRWCMCNIYTNDNNLECKKNREKKSFLDWFSLIFKIASTTKHIVCRTPILRNSGLDYAGSCLLQTVFGTLPQNWNDLEAHLLHPTSYWILFSYDWVFRMSWLEGIVRSKYPLLKSSNIVVWS